MTDEMRLLVKCETVASAAMNYIKRHTNRTSPLPWVHGLLLVQCLEAMLHNQHSCRQGCYWATMHIVSAAD